MDNTLANQLDDMSVDVVIPTYNCRELLIRAVDSALKQSLEVNRIIVMDDGSDKPTIDFMKEHLGSLSKVELYYNEHSGLPGKLRGAGVRKSQAQWIAFLDSDDWWEPNKLENQLTVARQEKVDLVCTNAETWESGVSKGNLLNLESGSILIQQLINDNSVINSSVLVNRLTLLRCDEFASDFQTRGVEDYCMWLRFLSFGRIFFINKKLVNYSIQPFSISRSFGSNPRPYALIDYYRWLRDRKFLTRRIKKLLFKNIKNGI